MTLGAAVAAAVGGWAAVCLLLRKPMGAVVRKNYRGHEVVATLGVALWAGVLFGGLAAAALAAVDEASWREATAITGVGLVMCLLGWLDDRYGDRTAGGFRGHLAALWRGRVTTGLVKAVGGGVVGLAAAWAAGLRGWWIVVGGAVIALGANLANLLDLRPGRALKAWVLGWVALLAAGPPASALVTTSALAGGVAAFLPSDLDERGMLGDGGANLAGGTLAAAAAVSVEGSALLAVLGALLALNLLSEMVSFSRVIEAVGPLRAADRWGRREP